MKRITDIAWLADENIHPGLITRLKGSVNVKKLSDYNLLGSSDTEILSFAYASNFAILTQDADFGKLAIYNQAPFIGIIYLRPGHVQIDIQLSIVEQIIIQEILVTPPFLLVAAKGMDTIKIRVRNQIFNKHN